MTTILMQQKTDNMTRVRRAVLALAFVPFLAGWSPPVSVLGSPLYMFFGDPDRGNPDLRPLEMTPNDVATACTRYRSGTVSYRLEDQRQTFSLTCTIPAQKETTANRTRFYFFVVNPAGDKPTTALGKIEVYGSNLGKSRWVKFSEPEEKSLMKSIRDMLQDDNLIEGPEEGQDAFGHWRRCMTQDDSNCYPKAAF